MICGIRLRHRDYVVFRAYGEGDEGKKGARMLLCPCESIPIVDVCRI